MLFISERESFAAKCFLKAYFVLGPSDLNMVSLKETAQNIKE